MLAKFIAFLSQFIPGPKAIATAIVPGMLWLDHHFKLGISDAKVITVGGVVGAYLATHFIPAIEHWAALKFNIALPQTITRAILPFVCIAGLLGLGGCSSISPTTIQADVALGLSTALQGALVGDPAIDKQLKTDCSNIAKLINSAILPQLQGAKLGTVLANAGPQALSLLQAKILGSKNGSKVMAEIKLWAPVALGALASVNSPGSYLSPQAQADLTAFFTGVSQGISAFVGDPSLMPPAPPTVTAPAVPIAPAPAAPASASKP